MNTVLIVEDDSFFSRILSGYLQQNGYKTAAVANIKAAKDVLHKDTYQLLLLDYHLPDGEGIDLLHWMVETGLKTPVIIMTSFHDVRTAVKCIKKGAVDYITKPINHDELLMLIREVLEGADDGEISHAIPGKKKSTSLDFVKGRSQASQTLYEHIELVAKTEMSVLINGESGTGKEHVARFLHDLSPRAGQPFVAIDCGALSAELIASELFGHVKGSFTGAVMDKKGQLELAKGGTVFLDEVGNLSYEAQVKLLRALEEKTILPVGGSREVKIDVRIIAATNENFQQAIAQEKFRSDLYHRLNEFKIKTPALSERLEDMDELVHFFIDQSNRDLKKNVKGIDQDVLRIFLQYSWPGNMRELKNIIKRAVLLAPGEWITPAELPEEMEWSVQEQAQQTTNDVDLKHSQEAMEKELIQKALEETRYNKSKAAKLLNIDRTTLYNKMSKYGIE